MKKLTDCRLWSLDLAQNNYCIFQNCLVSSGTSVAMTGRCTDGHSVWLILLITSRHWASTQHRATLAEWMAPALCLNSVWVEMCSILQLHAVITFTIWCWRKHLADHGTVQWSRHSAIQAVQKLFRMTTSLTSRIQPLARNLSCQITWRLFCQSSWEWVISARTTGSSWSSHWSSLEVFQIVAWCLESWVTSIVHASPAAPANDMKLLKLLAYPDHQHLSMPWRSWVGRPEELSRQLWYLREELEVCVVNDTDEPGVKHWCSTIMHLGQKMKRKCRLTSQNVPSQNVPKPECAQTKTSPSLCNQSIGKCKSCDNWILP